MGFPERPRNPGQIIPTVHVPTSRVRGQSRGRSRSSLTRKPYAITDNIGLSTRCRKRNTKLYLLPHLWLKRRERGFGAGSSCSTVGDNNDRRHDATFHNVPLALRPEGLLRLKLSRRSKVKEWPTTADNTQDVKSGFARGNSPRCIKYIIHIKPITVWA